MLLNLSHHPLSKWSTEQRQAAEKEFGALLDLQFPLLDPAASLEAVREIAQHHVVQCIEEIKKRGAHERHAVHVMGEYTFTCLFVKEMERRELLCVASTTERLTTVNPDGSKTTVFRFVQFRPYFKV